MENTNIPKVSPESIAALMEQVTYRYHQPEGTTSTYCFAYLHGRFSLAVGHSACVDPRLFNAEKGIEIAQRDCVAKANQKLWELEGYRLYDTIRHGQDADHIARLAHEVNRAYCLALGDASQPSWEDAPEWQRVSARLGVALHLSDDHGPEASHASWMSQKMAEGWKWGPVKNPETKEHPCIVTFENLPKEQQAKDFLFRGVVNAFKGVM